MWTSYEAICELGGPIGNSDEADDPQSIFAVDPPSLSPRHTVNMDGGVDWAADKYRNMSYKYGTNNNMLGTIQRVVIALHSIDITVHRPLPTVHLIKCPLGSIGINQRHLSNEAIWNRIYVII